MGLCWAKPLAYNGPVATVTKILSQDQTTKGQPLQRVGDYKVHGQLGNGAYGAVYKVSKDHELYAMKVIDLASLARRGSIGARKNEALEVIHNEINVLKQIHHRNCVQLIESIEDPLAKKYFLIMELMSGGGILERLPPSKPYLPEEDARIAFREARCSRPPSA